MRVQDNNRMSNVYTTPQRLVKVTQAGLIIHLDLIIQLNASLSKDTASLHRIFTAPFIK